MADPAGRVANWLVQIGDAIDISDQEDQEVNTWITTASPFLKEIREAMAAQTFMVTENTVRGRFYRANHKLKNGAEGIGYMEWFHLGATIQDFLAGRCPDKLESFAQELPVKLREIEAEYHATMEVLETYE